MIEYNDDPPVLVFADGEAARARLAELVAGLGCRVAAAAPIEGSVARLDQQVLLRLVLVHAERDPGPEFDRLLDRLEAGARGDRFNSVVSTAPGLVDAVWSRASHPRVLQLTQPSPVDEVAAIAAALEDTPLRLHDVKDAARLQQLSQEIGRIAGVLAAIADETSGDGVVRAAGEAEEAAIDPGLVRAIIRARRLRDHYFRSDLFADPAWDMMLDLMAARLENRRVAVSSLCIAAAVPATTALRWIKGLTDRGLFVRAADPQDGRRVYIELSDAAAASLAAYLKSAQKIAPLIL